MPKKIKLPPKRFSCTVSLVKSVLGGEAAVHEASHFVVGEDVEGVVLEIKHGKDFALHEVLQTLELEFFVVLRRDIESGVVNGVLYKRGTLVNSRHWFRVSKQLWSKVC